MTFGRKARRRTMLLAASVCAGCLVFCAFQAVSPAPDGYIGSAAVPEEVTPITFSTGDGRINVNTADSAALQTLSGIGPSLAEAIVQNREQNGVFHYPEDLMNVSGIGTKTLEKIRDFICFE